MKWLQEVRRMGTTADKVAAMTLLLQESAVSNLRSLDELLRWVSKRSGARAVAGQVPMLCSFPAYTYSGPHAAASLKPVPGGDGPAGC